MSGSEEKKLNSLHEEDSLYKAQGGKAAYQISPTYGQNTLYKVNPVSAGRAYGTVQEKPGKGESDLSSQPFTLHFSPLFSREG